MSTFADLQRTVQATIASKRLGKPVFVRLTWQGRDKPETLVPRLAQLVSAVQQWLGQPPEQLHASGFAPGGMLSLTLRFREGATALVSIERGPPRGDGLDVMVLGNHGAINHDAGSAELWDEAMAVPAEQPDPALVALIRRAVLAGKPIAVEAGGKP